MKEGMQSQMPMLDYLLELKSGLNVDGVYGADLNMGDRIHDKIKSEIRPMLADMEDDPGTLQKIFGMRVVVNNAIPEGYIKMVSGENEVWMKP